MAKSLNGENVRKFKINSKKVFKISLIVYAFILVLGIVFGLIFGLSLDINFKGGTIINYKYTGEVAEDSFRSAVAEVIDKDFTVSANKSIAGNSQTYSISLVGNDSLSNELQTAITTKLEEKFPDNSFSVLDSNSVSPTVAGTFFLKSLVAVAIAAALVIVYVGIRFKKIGGVTAAITALCALVIDLMVTFVTCIVFRLQIDSNYIAVVLTILGYSLNDTIVCYDRVRENKKLFPTLTTEENMNLSISGILTRNIVTSVTTSLAVLTIVVVSELYGLSSLRTFAIPMTFGLLSGCVSSLFISGPLWVYWQEKRAAKKAK
ncbi:MAG: protein translocase subunit SecF [Clostridia bacterium]|nr:protein translocase subunit SecF [Clostridia bacterium]